MTMTLEDVGHLPVEIRYVGEVHLLGTSSPNRITVDQWAITVFDEDGTPHVFDYFTGLGCRNGRNGRNEPNPPKVADVMCSLICDAGAEQQNFNEWCSDYGHSLDSISALNAYRACLDTAAALRKCFSYELLAELRDLLAEY
jgi:hypothetical protein